MTLLAAIRSVRAGGYVWPAGDGTWRVSREVRPHRAETPRYIRVAHGRIDAHVYLDRGHGKTLRAPLGHFQGDLPVLTAPAIGGPQ